MCSADSVEYMKTCLHYGNCSRSRSSRAVGMGEGPSPEAKQPEVTEATLEPSIPILVIACNRPDYVVQTLESLLRSAHVHTCIDRVQVHPHTGTGAIVCNGVLVHVGGRTSAPV